MKCKSLPISGVAVNGIRLFQKALAVHLGVVDVEARDVEVAVEGEVEHEAAQHPPVPPRVRRDLVAGAGEPEGGEHVGQGKALLLVVIAAAAAFEV